PLHRSNLDRCERAAQVGKTGSELGDGMSGCGGRGALHNLVAICQRLCSADQVLRLRLKKHGQCNYLVRSVLRYGSPYDGQSIHIARSLHIQPSEIVQGQFVCLVILITSSVERLIYSSPTGGGPCSATADDFSMLASAARHTLVEGRRRPGASAD